ncbi:hypothetical protein GQ457_07G022730 [Hibiscus cannabinus]
MDHKLVEHPKGKADPNLSDLIALVISVAFVYPLNFLVYVLGEKSMVFRLNPGAGGEAAKAEAEAEGVEKGWFQEKKGSVFPVKKKLVKTMMVEYIAKSFSIKMGGSSNTSPSKSSIFPHP